MIKITKSEDCGNSPKNILIQDLTIAFAKGNTKVIKDSVTDDIRWNIVGDQEIEGKDDFVKALNHIEKVSELTIHHIATHGKAGAVNGTRKLSKGRTIAFCDVYEFGNTKGTVIKEITSYRIQTSG